MGGVRPQPTNQPREPSSLNTCDANSSPLLRDGSFLPILHSLPVLDSFSAPLTWGLSHVIRFGQWEVSSWHAGNCFICAYIKLALLRSCDPPWEEPEPQSHCPFSLRLRVKLQGTNLNLPAAWSPFWPSLHSQARCIKRKISFSGLLRFWGIWLHLKNWRIHLC